MFKKALLGSICVLGIGALTYLGWQNMRQAQTIVELMGAFRLAPRLYLRGKSDYGQNLRAAAQIIKGSVSSPSELTKATMLFVHENSKHLIDEKHSLHVDALSRNLQEMLNWSTGRGGDKPHMSCGPRAQLMSEILANLGIRSRVVHIFSDSLETLTSHRLLEVYNSERSAWELWDPDLGVQYLSLQDIPLDVVTFIRTPREEVVPVSNDARGWDETRTSYLKPNEFGVVIFEEFTWGTHTPLTLIDPARFDLNKRFATGQNFLEWATQSYGPPRIVLLK